MRFADLDSAAERGMSIAYQAAVHPERRAILSDLGNRTFAELNRRANRVAHLLRSAGIEHGDGVAVLAPNRPEFAEVTFAAMRSGVRLTPINWHLSPDDVAYVVRDSGARALFADGSLVDAATLAAETADRLVLGAAFGSTVDGFDDYERRLAAESPDDVADPVLGDTMLYTSGTTGRPKGVRRPMPEPRQMVEGMKLLAAVFGFQPEGSDVALATGPLYHSGPIHLCLSIPLNAGIPTILMSR